MQPNDSFHTIPPSRQNKTRNITQRLYTALVLIPAVMGILLYAPTWVPHVLWFISFGIMGYEWASMVSTPFGLQQVMWVLSLVGLTYSTQSLTHPWYGLSFLMLTLICMAFMGRWSSHQRNHQISSPQTWLCMGTLYLASAFWSLLKITECPWIIIWLFIIVWGNDSFAYIVGKGLGGKKLCPSISPGKTWSGFLGGVILGSVASGLFAVFLAMNTHIQSSDAFIQSSLTLMRTYPIALSLILSIAGHLGDLLESAAKRHFNIKDSGSIIPGHGGFLDRLDSLLAVSILFMLCVFVFQLFYGVE